MQKQRRTQKRRRRDERQSRTRKAKLREVQSRDQRREQREQSAGRDETLSAGRDEMQSPGRDESRAPAETRIVSKQTQSESENTSNDSLKLELVRRAFLYRESATAVLVLLVDSDLQEHANGRRKRRTSSASSAAHSSSSCALLHKTRACDNTAYIFTITVCTIHVVYNLCSISMYT